jgi:hypothetical protein
MAQSVERLAAGWNVRGCTLDSGWEKLFCVILCCFVGTWFFVLFCCFVGACFFVLFCVIVILLFCSYLIVLCYFVL